MKDLQFIPENEKFLQKADEFTHKYFIKRNKELLKKLAKNGKLESSDYPNDWKLLKNIFLELQEYRCAICEDDLNSAYSTVIEHFRPKSQYWWLAYNYRNYYLTCGECNSTFKRTQFPVFGEQVNYKNRQGIHEEYPLLVNPLYENPSDYFYLKFKIIEEDIKIISLTIHPQLKQLPPTNFQRQKAEKTLEIFNLNWKRNKPSYHQHLKYFRDEYDKLHNLARQIDRLYKRRKSTPKSLLSPHNRDTFWTKYHQKFKFSSSSKTGYIDMILMGNYYLSKIN